MPRSDFNIQVHVADVDSGEGTPYQDVLITTIDGYDGYATASFSIIQIGQNVTTETAIVADTAGNTFAKTILRDNFQTIFFPFRYNSSPAYPDLDDIATYKNLIAGKKRLWVNYSGGSRTFPADPLKCYPVYIESTSESINPDAATHGLEVTFRHRFPI